MVIGVIRGVAGNDRHPLEGHGPGNAYKGAAAAFRSGNALRKASEGAFPARHYVRGDEGR